MDSDNQVIKIQKERCIFVMRMIKTVPGKSPAEEAGLLKKHYEGFEKTFRSFLKNIVVFPENLRNGSGRLPAGWRQAE